MRQIELREAEFLAACDPQIASAPNKAAWQKLIDALPKKNPPLAREFEEAKHAAEAAGKFVRHSGRYSLTAVGDVSAYALFAEHAGFANSASLSPDRSCGRRWPTRWKNCSGW